MILWKWLRRIFLLLIITATLTVCVVAIAYLSIPKGNTSAAKFDTIIVLGAPANPDGTPGPEQLTRTLEGVAEYKRGVAHRIIMTGGAAHNRYVESDVMARIAEEHGVPAAAVLEDRQSANTIENAYYAAAIMKREGWHSAEIVSSDSHLPRASLIFQHFPITFTTHAAPWPHVLRPFYPLVVYIHEAEYCTRLRLLGFKPNVHLPQ